MVQTVLVLLIYLSFIAIPFVIQQGGGVAAGSDMATLASAMFGPIGFVVGLQALFVMASFVSALVQMQTEDYSRDHVSSRIGKSKGKRVRMVDQVANSFDRSYELSAWCGHLALSAWLSSASWLVAASLGGVFSVGPLQAIAGSIMALLALCLTILLPSGLGSALSSMLGGIVTDVEDDESTRDHHLEARRNKHSNDDDEDRRKRSR